MFRTTNHHFTVESVFVYPPVIKHGWLENPLGMEVSTGKSLINDPCSIVIEPFMLSQQWIPNGIHVPHICWFGVP